MLSKTAASDNSKHDVQSQTKEDILWESINEEGEIAVDENRGSLLNFDELRGWVGRIVGQPQFGLIFAPAYILFQVLKLKLLDLWNGLESGPDQPRIVSGVICIQPYIVDIETNLP